MKIASVFLSAIFLWGCAGGTGAPAPRTLDLGVSAGSARLPAMRAIAARAAAPFDGVEMHYRLAWRNPAELASFAHSRWAAPPAELLRKQLLRASAEGVGKCGLEFDVQEFTQIFASKEASEARIELAVFLGNGSARIGSRHLTVVEANAGADAASGAAALARAADRAAGELARWIGAQPGCR